MLFTEIHLKDALRVTNSSSFRLYLEIDQLIPTYSPGGHGLTHTHARFAHLKQTFEGQYDLANE